MSRIRFVRPRSGSVLGPRSLIEVTTGRTFTGVQLRLALLVVTVALAVVCLVPLGAAPGAVVLLALLGGVLLAWEPVAAPVAVALVALSLLAGSGSFDPIVLALLPLAHAALRLSWWASHVPPTTRVERVAMLPDLRRAVVLQLGLQALGVVSLLVTRAPGTAIGPAVGGVALLVLTVLLLLPRRDRGK